jgi:hypothetical protein
VRDKQTPFAAAPIDAGVPGRHAGLVPAIREAWLHFQREFVEEHESVHREPTPFGADILHAASRSGCRGKNVALPEGHVGIRSWNRSRSFPEFEKRMHAEYQERHTTHQAQKLQASPRKRVYAGAGALIVAGSLFTGLWARDKLIPVLDALWHGTHAADRGAKSQVAVEKSPHSTSIRTPEVSGLTGFSLPKPDSYGLYAVNNGRLTRLEPMGVRIPDAQIALPALITKPSPVTLPDGRVRFIAYQRDLATSAPVTASIRTIARVVRTLTFAATGKSKVTPVQDTWAIRAVSGEMAIAPVPGSPEMMLIKSPEPDLALLPGRYMLVFGNQAYDFTVDGEVTDPAQCLERAETQNGDVYTECRSLP